jgi:hypothetical protein
LLWLWTALLSAVALVPTYTNRGNALVPLAVAGLALLLFTYFHPGMRTRGDDESRGEDAPDEDADATTDREVVDLEERRRARSG